MSSSPSAYDENTEQTEDRSYGFQLESEIKAQEEKPEDLPEGMHYIADTRRQSVDQKLCQPDATKCKDSGREYLPIEDYAIIGNLRTVALCGTDGSIDFFCYPQFDSPSVFCRLLDKDKGGHFSITPTNYQSNRQQYLPSSNILATRFMSDDGVSQITDYMHLPTVNQRVSTKPLLPWIIRTVEVIRGTVEFDLECFPAFNYARDTHTTEIVDHKVGPCEKSHLESMQVYPEEKTSYYAGTKRVVFKSKTLTMDLRHIVKCGDLECPAVNITIDKAGLVCSGLKGPGARSRFTLQESQRATFIFRQVPEQVSDDADIVEKKHHLAINPPLTASLMEALFRQTATYWQTWVESSIYRGRWREPMLRSALTLKLLTYEPTGAVVAAATFGIPEAIGGPRNWDYRYVWVRDASFTIYAFLRLGFTKEAERYMHFIEERCNDLNDDGSLNIMYSIDGSKKLDEYELDHLDGYRSSRPVRIGNGAYDHLQMDIYGELLDCIYLYNKYGSPVSYDMWCSVRKLVNYVCDNYYEPDMSIWEVRLRLADKRVFPCQDRDRWMKIRDEIYELVQTKCYNKELKMFSQSVEFPEALDASTLIMPLVFFMSPTDPRLLSTIDKMLLPPEKGGLVANDLVFRYNFLTTDDGVGGLEGAFSMCTFWLVEALTRAGKYDKKKLKRAVAMFEKMLSYSNHVGLFSEEVARSGELLAAYNLDRSVRLALINRQFDDQYTFELKGYLSLQQFCSALCLFNQATRQKPPPGNKLIWLGSLLTAWLFITVAIYSVWQQAKHPSVLLIIPLLIVLTSLNIRGINYRFSKNGLDLVSPTRTSFLCFKPVYAIIIEFDNRYTALTSQQFNDPSEDTFYPSYLGSPAPVHVVNTEKHPSMFYDSPHPLKSFD
ncbi:Six-hairpin glycosidase-like protein [Phycomyces blakesleeanus]|uniref:Six-hairpin glycosidase-like protein n=1 Tax=Phycomyces blakesleeanus TaxID=4837 RepID=A0ABR3AUL9_PHYBL